MEAKDQGDFLQACLALQEISGKVSASVTHEIKNQLTVINEQASLLGDLSLMAAKTGTLDPDRVQSLSGRIVERVHQADVIVKRFNTFAHSSDQPLGGLEGGTALGLMAAMHQRLADRARVVLEFQEPDASLPLTTRPLFLLGALFACLEAAVAAAPEQGRVRAWVEKAGDGVRFAFAWDGGAALPEGYGPGPELLAVVGGRLEGLDQESGLALTVPRMMPGLDGM